MIICGYKIGVVSGKIHNFVDVFIICVTNYGKAV